MRQAAFVALCFTACASCDAQELSPRDPAIQQGIQKVLQAFQQPVEPRYNVAAFTEVQLLKNAVEDDKRIVEQLAIFAANPAGDESQPMAANVVLTLLDLPPTDVIAVLAPYLDAENERLREFTRDWFQAHDNAGPDETPLTPVNYQDYADYVRELLRRNEEVPTAFVEYIYERSPERALLVFHRASRLRGAAARLQEERAQVEAAQRRVQNAREGNGEPPEDRDGVSQNDIILAQRIVSNAIRLKGFEERFQRAAQEAQEQLAKLADREEWWVRLYVAEIMRWHRELRQPDVLEKLSGDDHGLISKSARAAMSRP